MSTQENRAAIARIYEEMWNQGSEEVIDTLMSPNYVDHDNGDNLVGTVGNPPDVLSELKLKLRLYRAAFPDLHFTVEDRIAEGDQVVTRWTASGTLLGPLGQIPPTGKKATVQGVDIYRLENGKVVEGWGYFDMLSLLRQVGALPTPQPVKA